jgi:hypothetical protein
MTTKRKTKLPEVEKAEIALAGRYLTNVQKAAAQESERAFRNRSLEVAISLLGTSKPIGEILRQADAVYEWLANGKLPTTVGLRAVETGQA